ncbi:MAG: hypothetical protein JNJ91_04885 [Flavobacteriales bacterium]|nr:hypothetical protein [Flavobacteriales bacterium]
MPIRMTDDRNEQQPSRRSTGGGGGGMSGGGGGMGSLLPMLIGLLMKKPKLMLIVLGIGAVLYFTGGLKGCLGEGGADVSQLVKLATGGNMDPAVYDKAEVFEPLADNVNAPLPERHSLEQYAPKRQNQGQQGSCVAWASAYAARTIVQAAATKQDPNSTAFSPAFMYNQIKIENSDCQGSYIQRAMDQMKGGGALPYSQFGYTDESCAKLPTEEQRRQASQFRIKGSQRLSKSDDPRSMVDMVAMKQQLAQGSPIVIGMMVGGSFMQDMMGQDKWLPTQSDYAMRGFGGHAMCVIGYDDYKFQNEYEKPMGGFQIMNSWGPEWGKNGLAWVSYDDFAHFTKEAYAVYPQGEGVDVKPSTFDIRFGLPIVDDAGKPTGEYIALKHMGGRTFRTEKPIAKGTRFKVEMTNNTECYAYCFGQEVDGSTYVLFPNTPKHSPYCGITGTRQFPRDQSMTADDVGTTDVMTILVYNQAIDFNKVDGALKASTAKGMDAKLSVVLGTELAEASSLNYTQGKTFGATGPANKAAMAVVLEIEKR